MPEPAIRAAAPPSGEFRIRSAGAALISAAEGDSAKLATFSGNAYTGAPMRPEGWWLPVVVDLAGIKVPSQHRPALRQHDHEQIVGHTTSVKADAKGIHVEGVFSGQAEHTAKVVEPARNGFQWQLSIGANPTRTEHLEAGEETEVNGRTVTGPMTIARETEIGEISFVPLGADGDTSATVQAQRGRQTMFKTLLKQLRSASGKPALRAGKYNDDEIDKMSEDEAKGALKKCMAEDEEDAEAAKKAKAKASEDRKEEEEEEEEKKAEAARKARIAAARKAEADELNRIEAIKARCRKHGVIECEIDLGDGKKERRNLAVHGIEAGLSPDAVELLALRAARPGPGVGLPGGLGYSTGQPRLNDAVLEAAVLQAARHQYRLGHDDFWVEATPDGKSSRPRAGTQQIRAQAAAEAKGRYTDEVEQAAWSLFKGRLGLHQLLLSAAHTWGAGDRQFDLRSEGGVTAFLRAWDQHEIRAEGSSNLSISNILANVLNKFALQGYLYTEQTWREIAGIRSVNDFKPTKSINLLGDVMYKQIGPSGELANASLGDQAFANQAANYGRILTLPWQHIVNDDLGMLTGAPMKLGQGAGLALNDYFWSLWAAMASGSTVNGVAAPNGDDGNAFWRTTSLTTAAAKRAGTAYQPNKDTGAALSATSLKTAKALFDNQWDPNGNPLGFDGSTPILLHGPSTWYTVSQLIYGSTIIAAGLASTSAYSSAPNNNPWQGTMKPVMSRYIENASYGNSATAFWVLFNPVALPVIEVAFLNGVDTPAVLTAGPDYQFDRLGISIRGTMPFGVTQQNFRGGVYNAGA